MLFQEQERDNRMRAQTDEARYPAPEHPFRAFKPIYVRQQSGQPFALFGAHHARLDHVDGAADRRCHETRQERGREMRREVILQRRVGQEHTLEAVVRGQLAGCHQHRAHAVRPHAPEQTPPPFFSCHAYESVDSVLVVAAVMGRERCVMLHPDVEDVGGVTGDAAEEPGCAGHGDEGGEGWCGEGGGEDFFEFFVDAEPGCAVGQLAQYGRRKLG